MYSCVMLARAVGWGVRVAGESPLGFPNENESWAT